MLTYISESNESGINILSENALFKSELISLNPSIYFSSSAKYLAFSTTIEAIDVLELPQLYPTELMERVLKTT